MKSVLILMIAMASISVGAQEFYNFEEPIQVSGTHKGPTAAEKLKVMRRKLEIQNELLVRKQIEKLRFQQEVQLMKNMQQIFNENMKRLNQI